MNTSITRGSVFGVLFLATFVGLNADDKKPNGYEFKVEKIKPQTAMTIRFRVTDPNNIGAKYGEAFGRLFGHISSKGGQIVGMPFGRYHSITKDGIEIEAGIPVAKTVEEKDDIKASELPGGKVITTIHMGPYEELSKAHEALQKWIKDKGYKSTGGMWEYYLTDPGEEPDSSKWQTKLYQPIGNKDNSKPK